MKITIYYNHYTADGKASTGSVLTIHDKWDMGVLPDDIARLYQNIKGNVIIQKIEIERR